MFMCALVIIFMFGIKGLLSKKPNNVAARTRSFAGSTSIGVRGRVVWRRGVEKSWEPKGLILRLGTRLVELSLTLTPGVADYQSF